MKYEKYSMTIYRFYIKNREREKRKKETKREIASRKQT